MPASDIIVKTTTAINRKKERKKKNCQPTRSERRTSRFSSSLYIFFCVRFYRGSAMII